MSDETNTCPNCGAPRVCEPGQEIWEYGCFYGFGDHACDYAAGLLERAERAEALLHRVATTDITSSEWPMVMHEVRAWEGEA